MRHLGPRCRAVPRGAGIHSGNPGPAGLDTARLLRLQRLTGRLACMNDDHFSVTLRCKPLLPLLRLRLRLSPGCSLAGPGRGWHSDCSKSWAARSA